MASLYSFDIVSTFDRQELKNAIDQAEREIQTRYDLKDTKTQLTLGEHELTISTASDLSLQAVRDILESKAIRRGLSLKIFDYQPEEESSGGRVRQTVKLREGIPDDLARQLAKKIRDEHKKVTPQIQGDALRVQAKTKDDLQAVIQELRGAEYPVALQFVNYR